MECDELHHHHHYRDHRLRRNSCKGDHPFQWEIPKFEPLPRISKALNLSIPRLAQMIISSYLPLCKISLKSVHRGLLREYVQYNDFVTCCTLSFHFLSFLQCDATQSRYCHGKLSVRLFVRL